MPEVLTPTVSPGNLMPEQRDALRKLLESQTFATAPRLRGVLAYLVHGLEDGTAEHASEQSIGQEVFGKPAGYNASEDNIVRVTIRHLRTRLEEYYQSEGRDDAWVLTVPKGKYVPLLVPAPVVPHSATPPAAETVAPQPVSAEAAVQTAPAEKPPATAATDPGNLRLVVILVAVVVLSGVAGLVIKSMLARGPQVSSGVFGQLSRTGDDVSVVVVDSNLQAYRQIFHRQVTLDNYIHRNYANEPLPDADPRLTDAEHFASGSNETNVSSAIFAAALRQALDGRRIAIKHPHDTSVREFQNGKLVILLGGPFSNPWGQLFENRLNFRLLPVPQSPSGSQVHNLKPAPGEAADYIPYMDGNLAVNYVRIAILPNFENSGHVILLGATSGESLEEAGTYLLSDESISDLEKLFHTRSIANLPPLEFLLEVRGLNAVPNSHRIIGYRSVPVGSDH